MEAMITDMMSGKESDKEEDPIIVQPLHWRSPRTEKMMKAMTISYKRPSQSNQKKQLKNRFKLLIQNIQIITFKLLLLCNDFGI